MPALTRLATIMATARVGMPTSRTPGPRGAGRGHGPRRDPVRGPDRPRLGVVGPWRPRAAAGVAEEAADVARAVRTADLGPVLEPLRRPPRIPASRGPPARGPAVYQRSGAALAADRAQPPLARLPGQVGPQGASARAAARRLRRVGSWTDRSTPGGRPPGALEIRVIGGFAVHRDGVPSLVGVALAAGTHAAKLLVAREGRPIGRERSADPLARRRPRQDRPPAVGAALHAARRPRPRQATLDRTLRGRHAQGIRLVLGTRRWT